MQLMLQNHEEVGLNVGNSISEGRSRKDGCAWPKPRVAGEGVVGVVVLDVDASVFGGDEEEMESDCSAG